MSGLGGIGSGGVVYPRQAEGPGGSDASPAAAAHADCGSSAPARAAAGSGGRAAILTNLEKQATRLAPPDPGVAYNPSRDARTLHEAMKGLGTDEEAVFSILESRTPEQLQELEAHFAKSYSKKWGSLRLA
ncbi:MAG: annexin, partial [Planctomycetota bacterium]